MEGSYVAQALPRRFEKDHIKSSSEMIPNIFNEELPSGKVSHEIATFQTPNIHLATKGAQNLVENHGHYLKIFGAE